MRYIVLSAGQDGRIQANFLPGGNATVFHRDDLTDFVREHEREHPRWVWDDTVRWYPELLAKGVRVRRCTDLRLCHNILRNSPFADQALLMAPDSQHWDALAPAEEFRPALFAAHELTDHLDVVGEHVRQQTTIERSPQQEQLALLTTAESSGALAAAEMTHAGLPWSVELHHQLLAEKLGPRPRAGQRPEKLQRLAEIVRSALDAPGLNPDSPAEVLTALQRAGVQVDNTRSWRLEREKHHGIPPLLEYKKLSRLHTANGWQWVDTWVANGRFRSQFLVGGVVTGRWASKGGGALAFPAELRQVVVADEGWKFVVADVAQLEPRALAGCSGDLAMVEASKARDLYEGIVKSGAVATRNDAKLGLLGAMYGGTSGESGRMIDRMKRWYPRAVGFVEEAARTGEGGGVVHTRLGRGSPLPDAAWVLGSDDERRHDIEQRERRAWGRFTRNFVIQGTGAEWTLCWLADLRNRLFDRCDGQTFDGGPHLAFFLHDEVVVHTPADLAEQVAEDVRAAAVRAGRLLFGDFPVDFPLDVSVVDSWG